MSFTLHTAQWAEAIGFVVGVTGKDSAEVLNKSGLTALIGGKGVKGALQRTPKADAGRIQQQLSGVFALRIIYARAKRKGKRLKRVEAERMAKALVRRRMNAASYTRGPGWNNAIKAMGGRGVRTNKRFMASQARHGSGKKATPESLIATIVNTAPASEKIGLAPLQAALDDTARDMVEYGTRKLQKRFDQVKPDAR